MGLSPKVKQTLHYINPFKPPKEAEEAGYADFRPVSGWRREFIILAIWNVADEIQLCSRWSPGPELLGSTRILPLHPYVSLFSKLSIRIASDALTEMRVWTWFSFVSLWWSQNYGAGSWSTGAALINAGLTFNQALGVSALGCILTSLVGVAAAVSHLATLRHCSWFALIVSASGCGISYRFPSLVQKYVRNVGIKDHGRV
jgi:hypothetical protein